MLYINLVTTFNADKSSEMLLNFGRQDVPLISGINRKSSVELLGILFDEKLSFNDHVKCITNEPLPSYTLFFGEGELGSLRELTLLYSLWYYLHLRFAAQFGAEHLMRTSQRLTEFSLKQFVLGSSTSTLL